MASDNIEVRGEQEELLDDTMRQEDNEDEQRRMEKNDYTELDERLRAAREEIRTNTLMCQRRDSFDKKRFQEYTKSLPQPKTAKVKILLPESYEDKENRIMHQMKSRSALEQSRLDLEKSMLTFEQVTEK